MDAQDHSLSHSSRLQLDDLDTKIVQLLHRDGRMPYTEIAKQVNSSEATIRNRVQKLIDSGAIKIQAYLNPDKLGYRHIALVGVNFSSLQEAEAAARQLCGMDEVSYVAFTVGAQDLFLEVTFDNHLGLLDFLSSLRSLPGVTVSQTQIVLKLLKSQYSFHIMSR